MANIYYIDVPVDPRLEKLLSEYSVVRKIKAKSFLIKAGDKVTTLCYLHSGQLTHFAVNDQGVEKVAYINNPGSFTNENLFSMQNGKLIAKNFVIAKTDSVVFVIDKNNYMQLIKQDLFAHNLQRSFYQKYKVLREEVDSIVFNSAHNRLLQLFIANIDLKAPLKDGMWNTVRVNYTQQELSAIIGAHRVSIARLINQLCADNDIRIVNRKIEVNNRFVGK